MNNSFDKQLKRREVLLSAIASNNDYFESIAEKIREGFISLRNKLKKEFDNYHPLSTENYGNSVDSVEIKGDLFLIRCHWSYCGDVSYYNIIETPISLAENCCENPSLFLKYFNDRFESIVQEKESNLNKKLEAERIQYEALKEKFEKKQN